MIQKLQINNFQSHKNTTLNFHPGVNLIVGQSDSGKTAILRSLKWVVWNRPGGDAFRSHWGGDTEVRLTIDKQTISRIKTKVENEYKLDDEIFTAFGTSVPTEIESVLNLNEINLQQQLDSPFLLTSTPGEVANHFSRIAHLDKINVGLKNVKKEVNRLQRDMEKNDQDINEKQEELKKYDELDKHEQFLEVIEEMENEKVKLIKEYHEIIGLMEEIEEVSDQIKEYDTVLIHEKKIDSVIELIDKKDSEKTRINEIESLLDKIEHEQNAINEFKRILTNERPLDNILLLIEEKTIVIKEYRGLRQHFIDIRDTKVKISDFIDKIEEKENELHKHMPEECPLCGSKIK